MNDYQQILDNLSRSNTKHLLFKVVTEEKHPLKPSHNWGSDNWGEKTPRNETGRVIKVLELFPQSKTEQSKKNLEEFQKKIAEIRDNFIPTKIRNMFDQFAEYPNMRLLNDLKDTIIRYKGFDQWLTLLDAMPIEEESFNYYLNFELEIHPIVFTSEEDAKRVLKFIISEKEDINENTEGFPQTHIGRNRNYKGELKKLIKNKILEETWDNWKEKDNLRISPELYRISKKYLIPKIILIREFSEIHKKAELEIETKEINIFNSLNEKRISGAGAAEDIDSTVKKDLFWKTGGFPLSSEFAIDWLKKELLSREESSRGKWVMLLGAAGNGKSHMANQLKQRLESEETASLRLKTKDQDNGIDIFKVSVEGNEEAKEFTSVNDATVLGYEELPEKLKSCYEEKNNLLIAINKGVLVDSQNYLEVEEFENPEDPENPIKALIDWLIEPSNQKLDDLEINSGSDNKDRGYLWKVIYKDAIEILVVQMDYASLLENCSDIDISVDEGKLSIDSYRINENNQNRVDSLAGKYLNRMLKTIDTFYDQNKDQHGLLDKKDKYSPFRANLDFLKENLDSYLEIIRSAEIASGYNLTYRDLNHMFVLSTIGHDKRSRSMNKTDRYQRDERWFKSNKRRAEEQQKNIQYLQNLASKRLHMSIFDYDSISEIVRRWSGFQIYEDDAFLRATSLIDPIFDSSTSNFVIVNEALSAMTLDEKPSAIILEEEPEFEKAWSDFDINLENRIMYYLSLAQNEESITNKEISELRRWYGVYLYRLYGLFKGISGHHDIINSWKELWLRCAKDQRTPENIERGLKVILFGSEEKMYLPILSNRANPIHPDEIHKKQIAYTFQTNDFKFKWEIKGEKIFARLNPSENTDQQLSIPINFDLCKEILLCNSGVQGFSDTTKNLFNRFERFRNSLLSNNFFERLKSDERPDGAYSYNKQRINLK